MRIVARWVFGGMIMAAFMLRAPITAVPPLLESISATLALSPTAAGLVTTLPLLCFGAFAFAAPFLTHRLGIEPALWLALMVLNLGLFVRLVVAPGPFFIGTMLVGVGIAVGNVVVPALARSWFPAKLALVMGLYTVTITLSGAGGPAVTAALISHWEWGRIIATWIIPGLIALAVWSATSVLVRRARRGEAHHDSSPAGLGYVIRRPLSWIITGAMGLGSFAYYTLATWLPTRFASVGIDEATGGLMLAAFNLLGLPGAFLVKYFTSTRTAPRQLAVMWLTYASGAALLTVDARWAVTVGTIMTGVTQSIALASSLTFIAHQADPHDVPGVSALAQGVGYMAASIGPVVVGAIYGTVGSVGPGFWVVMAVVLAAGTCSFTACRELQRRTWGSPTKRPA